MVLRVGRRPARRQEAGAGRERRMNGARDSSIDAHLDIVAQAICESLDFWSADIWTLTAEGDAVVCRGFWSKQEDGSALSCVGATIALARSHDLRRLILAGETIERHSDDLGISVADATALRAQGLTSRMDIPLQLGVELLGVLSLGERREGRRLDAAELDLLRRLCVLTAVCVRAEALRQSADDRDRQLLELTRSGQVMLTSLRVRTTIESAAARVAGLLPDVACNVDVPLLRDDGSFARVVPGGGDEVEFGAVYETWTADALARQAVKLRRCEHERSRDGRARLIVPLAHGDGVVGYVDLRADLSRGFRRHEIEYIQLVADQVAATLANVRALRSLEQRVAIDAQTGLYGRWYFYERLVAEAARSRRYSQPLSLLVAEIDDLERVLTAQGRAAGERVVRAVARIVQSCVRDKVDVPCRHGITSFAILLPCTVAVVSGAGLVAQRLCEVADQTAVGDDDLGALGRFTLSIGVAGFPMHCDDADELASLAEEATRRARHQGGNRVVFAGRV
jgi:diguanylate cyclase (GGDEF)-like protein